jgi:hypothetical protein
MANDDFDALVERVQKLESVCRELRAAFNQLAERIDERDAIDAQRRKNERIAKGRNALADMAKKKGGRLY